MKALALGIMTFFVSVSAFADRDLTEYNQPHVALGLEGMDPVSFYSNEGPVDGDAAIQENYKGVLYQFSSEENKEIFLANPNKYEPTYGGWCAWAMVDGSKAPINTNFYSFDYNDLGERIRINFFFSARAMSNFFARHRSIRRKSSAEIADVIEGELANSSDTEKPVLSASRMFQADSDANWLIISREEPRFSNGVN